MTYLEAFILALVEGATEFLPISSTGHMILVAEALGIENTDFVKSFEIFIQLGAILAIVLLYARRFLTDFLLYKKLIAAFIPTAIVGLLAYDTIKTYLFNPWVVATMLIAGGIVLIILDRRLAVDSQRYSDTSHLPYRNAVNIGLLQCLSMVPGVSRAAATIIGGMVNGFNRQQAAEFSFLLAVPTMLAASGLDLIKSDFSFTGEQIKLLAVGFIVAFFSAWVFVLLMLRLLHRFGFSIYGYYRIVIGVLFLLFAR